jgi:hypothetical protein
MISPAKGLRQRDPLSPFLFILGFEVFSRLMHKEASLGHIKGLKIAKNNLVIHHLLFADDLLIFGKAYLPDANSIKSCLAKYCSWSSQSINTHKSSISFSKYTNPTISTSILQTLPYNPKPSTYIHLGLSIFLGISKQATFQSIIDQVQKRIDGWKAKTLSQVGKLVPHQISGNYNSFICHEFLLASIKHLAKAGSILQEFMVWLSSF